jgi:hypothetical protein
MNMILIMAISDARIPNGVFSTQETDFMYNILYKTFILLHAY